MPERTLAAWLSYLETLHPKAVDLGLERSAAVARNLGLLPFRRPVITVAGTNGKGSVVYGCDALLAAHGLTCGRYTSPHLRDFNERIVIGGRAVTDDAVVAAFTAIEQARGAISLTYFEFATLAALLLFRDARVDVALLEVGLGGRLDTVNIVDTDLAVITAIDLDHQRWLGDDRESIGREKAAIARRDRPVVLAEVDYPDSIGDRLAAIGASIHAKGTSWDWSLDVVNRELEVTLTAGDRLQLPLPPGLRPSNVAAALCASALHLGADFDAHKAVDALAALRVPGRRQRLHTAGRELLLDVAHNPAAMAALAREIRRGPPAGRSYAAFGVMADKDLPAMVAALAQAVDGACALALPAIERAQSPELVWQALDDAGIAVPQTDFTIGAVWQQLLEGSAPGDRIVVCGSFHSVAAIMTHLDIVAGLPPPAVGESLG